MAQTFAVDSINLLQKQTDNGVDSNSMESMGVKSFESPRTGGVSLSKPAVSMDAGGFKP